MALTQSQVARLYVTIFNRAPEGEGLQNWVKHSAATGANEVQIANEMLALDVSKQYFGATLNNNFAFIETIYKNLLGKDSTTDFAGVTA